MRFVNYKLEIGEYGIKISAENLVEFLHSDHEQIVKGSPKWWDDYVVSHIDFLEVDIYFLYLCTVFNGRYNAMTDYKKIWKLKNIPKGFYDNQYQNKRGRVYFGIIKDIGEEAFRSNSASMILLLPKGTNFEADNVYRILSEHKYDSLQKNDLNNRTLIELKNLYKSAILFKYSYIDEASLVVLGDNVNDWFENEVSQELETQHFEIIYRNV